MKRSALWWALVASALAASALGCEPEPPEGCGDGMVIIPESCDDGDTESGDGCAATCMVESGWSCAGAPSVCTRIVNPGVCGDGTLDAGEECDDGEETGGCDADCTYAACGDNVLNVRRGEVCEDGNMLDGDGCSRFCQLEPTGCGDSICVPEETCTGCPMDCADEPRCAECPDMDGDTFADSACGGPDCNDFDNAVHPDATEVPCNRIDEDCDPSTVDALDEDGDGASCNFDCDDTDPDRSPYFRERCGNATDDDCNADTPDVEDRDGDGATCDVDCNDLVATVCPDCVEQCGNGRDDDCDEATPDVDADDDGDCAHDCDDDDATRSSLLREICGNEIDDDCDDATADAVVDADMDGFDCAADCDDDDDTVSPDASGFCGAPILYEEGFEDDDGGWTTGGTRSSWEHGAPTATFIRAAATGANAWVTNLDGNYAADELSWVSSPAIDMRGAATDPVLRFAHIYDTATCCDFGWVEVSTDGGLSWRKVGRMGEGRNWYSAARDAWSGASGTSGVWRTAEHVLVGVAGQEDVRVRFVLDTDEFTHREGFGVDDVVITNRVADVGVVSLNVGTETCADATRELAITVRNDGLAPVPALEVSYTIDAGTPVVENLATALMPGEIRTHTFASPVDLSALASFTIVGRATVPMDADASDDSVSVTSTVVPVIVLDSLYSQDFESGPASWVSSGVSSSWEHGTPTGSYIIAAASGNNAWVTNLDGGHNNSESSSLSSPCFDLSGATRDATLNFSHIFVTEAAQDFGWVEIWRSSTGTWTKLGLLGSGANWYNRSNHVWSGTSGGTGVWRTASHPLTDSEGEEIVRVRFRFTSNATVINEGFGVDDVTLIP